MKKDRTLKSVEVYSKYVVNDVSGDFIKKDKNQLDIKTAAEEIAKALIANGCVFTRVTHRIDKPQIEVTFSVIAMQKQFDLDG